MVPVDRPRCRPQTCGLSAKKGKCDITRAGDTEEYEKEEFLRSHAVSPVATKCIREGGDVSTFLYFPMMLWNMETLVSSRSISLIKTLSFLRTFCFYSQDCFFFFLTSLTDFLTTGGETSDTRTVVTSSSLVQ